MQARVFGQSELMTHSGRHSTYGSPKYSDMHLHEAARLRSSQTAFKPQGLGRHGCIGSSGTVNVVNYFV